MPTAVGRSRGKLRLSIPYAVSILLCSFFKKTIDSSYPPIEGLECVVTAKTTGWVGMGINNVASMVGGDIMWGQIMTNGTPVVVDRFAYAHAEPAKDTQQDVFLIPGQSSGAYE